MNAKRRYLRANSEMRKESCPTSENKPSLFWEMYIKVKKLHVRANQFNLNLRLNMFKYYIRFCRRIFRVKKKNYCHLQFCIHEKFITVFELT